MEESPYKPFLTNLPDQPLSINDLIDIAQQRGVKELHEEWQRLSVAEWREKMRPGLKYYRLKLARPKAERKGYSLQDSEYWRIPPDDWYTYAGKSSPKWNGPAWESVCPKDVRFELKPEGTKNEKQPASSAPEPAPAPPAQTAEQKPAAPTSDTERKQEHDNKTAMGWMSPGLKWAAAMFFGAFLMFGVQAALDWDVQKVARTEGYSSAFEVLEKWGDRKPEHKALLDKAYLLYASGDPIAAEHTVLELLNKTTDQWTLARAYYQLGLCKHSQGKIQEAEQYFVNARDIFAAYGPGRNLFLTLIELARLGADDFAPAEALLNETSPYFYEESYRLHAGKAERYMAEGAYADALTEARAAYAAAHQTMDSAIQGWANVYMGITLNLNGQSGRHHIHKASDIAFRRRDQRLYAFTRLGFYLCGDTSLETSLRRLAEDDPSFRTWLRWTNVTLVDERGIGDDIEDR